MFVVPSELCVFPPGCRLILVSLFCTTFVIISEEEGFDVVFFLSAVNILLYIRYQENLQALLVDIHEDPKGFKEFVEVSQNDRRVEAEG